MMPTLLAVSIEQPRNPSILSGATVRFLYFLSACLALFSTSAYGVGFSLPVNYAVGITPVAIATGDFNEDGYVDLAVLDLYNSGGKSTVSILLNNGDGTFQPAVSYLNGVAGSQVAVGDFNNDGILDLAAGAGDGVHILFGNGDGTFSHPEIVCS